jgi:hypothetical protein
VSLVDEAVSSSLATDAGSSNLVKRLLEENSADAATVLVTR